LAVTQDQCERPALLGSITGSIWATRSPWQQYGVNVGESPTLLFNTGSMWASRPHSYPMAQTTPRVLAAHTQLGPPRNLPRGGSTGLTQIAEPRCAYAGCATPR